MEAGTESPTNVTWIGPWRTGVVVVAVLDDEPVAPPAGGVAGEAELDPQADAAAAVTSTHAAASARIDRPQGFPMTRMVRMSVIARRTAVNNGAWHRYSRLVPIMALDAGGRERPRVPACS